MASLGGRSRASAVGTKLVRAPVSGKKKEKRGIFVENDSIFKNYLFSKSRNGTKQFDEMRHVPQNLRLQYVNDKHCVSLTLRPVGKRVIVPLDK